MTSKTTSTTHNAGRSSPHPSEAHPRAGATTIAELIRVFLGLVMWTLLITVGAFWINPILGVIVAFFVAFAWLFFIAPRWAGQMVAAIILARRKGK